MIEWLRIDLRARVAVVCRGCLLHGGLLGWPAVAVGALLLDACAPANHFSASTVPVLQGWLGIGRTTFIIIILLLGAVIFIRDTERLVLHPLERMVQLVSDN